jgi:hypothetical protein
MAADWSHFAPRLKNLEKGRKPGLPLHMRRASPFDCSRGPAKFLNSVDFGPHPSIRGRESLRKPKVVRLYGRPPCVWSQKKFEK